jgi:hypothetical protein
MALPRFSMRWLLVTVTLVVLLAAGSVSFVRWQRAQYQAWKQQASEYMQRRQSLNAKMNQMPPEQFQRESDILDIEAGRLRIE